MQLEFDFTWFHFCELVDNETAVVIGGAVLECFCEDGIYYPTFEELEDFEFAPYTPRCVA